MIDTPSAALAGAIARGKQYLETVDLTPFAEVGHGLGKITDRLASVQAGAPGTSSGAAPPTTSGGNTQTGGPSGETINIDSAVAQGAGAERSFLVANTIISFSSGVTVPRRIAAGRCTQLATLQANQVPATTDGYMAARVAAYVDALTHMGWAQQAQNSGSQSVSGSAVTVQAAVFQIVADLLGKTGADLVKAILSGFTQLSSDSPTFTIFKQASTSANVAGFSLALASNDPNGDFLLNLIEFDVSAKDQRTDILFFGWDNSDAKVNFRSSSFSLDDDLYNALAPMILQQLIGVDGKYFQSFPHPQVASS